MKTKSLKSKFKLNAVKIIVIAAVVLFILILTVGVMKFYHFKSSFVSVSEEQSETAKNIVLQDLESRGKNVSNYEIQVMPKMQGITKKNDSVKIVQVFFSDKGNSSDLEPAQMKANNCSDDKREEKEFWDNKENCNEKQKLRKDWRNQRESGSYLIDLNSGKILMYSETDYYGDMPQNKEIPRWFHGGLMGGKK